MLRDHLAAWTTAAFAVLLILVTVSDQGSGGIAASVLLLLWAIAMLGVFLAVEHRVRGGPRGRAR